MCGCLAQPAKGGFRCQFLQHIFFEVTVTLALAQGVMPSGSTKPKVEVSRKKLELTFVDLDLLQVALSDSSMEVKGLGSKTISKRFIDPVNKIGIKIE